MVFFNSHTHTLNALYAFLAYFIALYALSIFASLLCVVNLKNHVVFCVGNAPAELVWVVWMSLWMLCSPRSLTHYVDAISAERRRYLYICLCYLCRVFRKFFIKFTYECVCVLLDSRPHCHLHIKRRHRRLATNSHSPREERETAT